MFRFVKIPSLIKRIFPNYVWDFSLEKKTIYLTFDDGPTPEITQWVLDQLNSYTIKSTFFCIGNNIEKHPEIFQKILKAGHTVGNHTYTHAKGWGTKKEVYLEEVEQTQVIISKALKTFHNTYPNSEAQQNCTIFRPPYGLITNSQGKALKQKGLRVIICSILTFDFDTEFTKEDCLKQVLQKTTDGDIVVFHDSVKASKNLQCVLPKFLKHFSELGYTFKPVSN